jgi:hypothetical protein
VHAFDTIPLRAICVWPVHYPGIHHYKDGGVSSNTTISRTTMFIELHKSSMRQYCSMLPHQGPNDTVLNQHRRRVLPWSSELTTHHFLPFPSSILHFPLVAPSSLRLNHFFNFSNQIISKPAGDKILNLASGTCHSTSTVGLYTKHSSTTSLYLQKGARIIGKDHLMQLMFQQNFYNVNAQVNYELVVVIKQKP